MQQTATAHRADYSAEKREVVMRYLESEVVTSKSTPMSADARLLLVVTLLCCDASGTISQTAMNSAMQDQSLTNAAGVMLAKAGL